MNVDFVHLRLHSEYSLVDSVVRLKELISCCIELNMPAVAVTEQANLFSLVKFYRLAQSKGIKPIMGADVLIHNPKQSAKYFRMTLLVQNYAGYISLSELLSMGYQEGQQQGVPMLKSIWLETNNAGLIAISDAREGDIRQLLVMGKYDLALQKAQKWANIFPDRFYLEIQRLGKSNEEFYIEQALKLGLELELPLVATNDVRFIKSNNFEIHEARVCIYQGRVLDDDTRPQEYTDAQFLRSPKEMQVLFSDIPEALENTVEIAKRCNLQMSFDKIHLPNFPIPDGLSMDAYFTQLAEQGLAERLQQHPPKHEGLLRQALEIYQQRLTTELKVIVQMGYPGYFLIVADFIQWAKNNAIPVGPGRGSGAGSLVAYALKITDLDPIAFDLLFERFLNPERVSMPDFDIDFCMDRRDEVIDYVAQRYGRDHVSQIITYGTMAAKGVVRDIGRVQGQAYGFVDRLAKLIPFEIGITLKKALKDSEELGELYKSEEEVKSLIDMAMELEGTCRNASKHAGGLVISPTKLTDFTPLYCEQGGNLVTQFDKDDIESIGLVKFDFLGLRTLTIIDWAVQTINNNNALQNLPDIAIEQIPRDDKLSYELLQKGETTALFQLESRGMKELIKKLRPDCFDDVIALVALYRPGPLESGMVDDYIKVKHGARAEYAHHMLEPILQPTNGIILYQEQVMQIARDLAGYTLGKADLLRRAMGKKKPEEMAQQRVIFTAGAIANNIEKKAATYIFDLMEKFAGYGFNKSHSVAYALIAYQTAWLKARHPASFMAAVLSAEMNDTDKLFMLIEECHTLKLKIKPPDINISAYLFTLDENNQIIYGIGAIKGVGRAAIEDLIDERTKGGVFAGLHDLYKRVDLRKVNSRVFEALVQAGAFDQFDDNRANLMAQLPNIQKIAEQRSRMILAGQNDLFGLDATEHKQQSGEMSAPMWSEKERLVAEKKVLGLYLSGHPIEQYVSEIAKITDGTIASMLPKIANSYNKTQTKIAGLAIEFRKRHTQQGKIMGFATLDDQTARLELALFDEVFQQYKDILLVKNEPIIAEGLLRIDNFSGNLRLVATKLYSMDQARNEFARSINITWRSGNDKQLDNKVNMLLSTLQSYRGGKCQIFIFYQSPKAKAELKLGDNWSVRPDEDLLNKLRKIKDFAEVAIEY